MQADRSLRSSDWAVGDQDLEIIELDFLFLLKVLLRSTIAHSVKKSSRSHRSIRPCRHTAAFSAPHLQAALHRRYPNFRCKYIKNKDRNTQSKGKVAQRYSTTIPGTRVANGYFKTRTRHCDKKNQGPCRIKQAAFQFPWGYDLRRQDG